MLSQVKILEVAPLNDSSYILAFLWTSYLTMLSITLKIQSVNLVTNSVEVILPKTRAYEIGVGCSVGENTFVTLNFEVFQVLIRLVIYYTL